MKTSFMSLCILSLATATVACGDDDSSGSTSGTSDGGTTTTSQTTGGMGGTGGGTGGTGGGTGGMGGAGGTGGGTGGNPDCYANQACDPLTPMDCDDDTGAGSACDHPSNDNVLECFAAPNLQMLGDPCGLMDGFCAHGLTCFNMVCAEFCCVDSDCTQGTCQDHPDPGTAGIRVCQM